MVRTLTPVARGSGDRLGLRSTSSEPMPLRARVIAATRPAGPAPAITTGTSGVRSDLVTPLRLLLGPAEALDGHDPGRVDDRAGVGQRLDQGPQPGTAGCAVVVDAVGVGRSRSAGARVVLVAVVVSWLMVSPLRGSGCRWHHARAR